MAGRINLKLLTDFFNSIGQQRRFHDVRVMSAFPDSGLNVHIAALRLRANKRHCTLGVK